MTDTMNYLKREDESQLEQWGYTSYKGEYGWSRGNTPLFKIIGRSESGTWVVFEIAKSHVGDRRDEELKFTMVDGYIRNTLAPVVPDEFVLEGGHSGMNFMGNTASWDDMVYPDGVCDWFESVGNEYDIVLRRRK